MENEQPARHYRIYLTDEYDLCETRELLWPGIEDEPKTDLDEAEQEFARLQGITEYCTVNRDRMPQNASSIVTTYPMLLVAMPMVKTLDTVEGQWEELYRHSPAIIFDDEEFDEFDVKEQNDPLTVEIGSREYVLFESEFNAGEAAAEYWRDMAKDDQKEFAAIIGEDRLVKWALGESDRFGISSLDEFLENASENPAEHHASYDGNEIEVQAVSDGLENSLGYAPGVAYRRN